MPIEKSVPLRPAEVRQIIDSIAEAVLILDLADERIVEANARACALYEIPHPEFIGMTPQDVSADFVECAAAVRDRLREGGRSSFEIKRRRRDGTEMNLQVRARTLEMNGRTLVLSLHRDITDEARMRQQLEIAASEWQMTFDAIEQCVVLVDENLVIQRANRSASALAEAIAGTDPVGARIDSLAAREPWSRAARIAAHTLAERIPASTQTTDPGTQRTWDLSATLIAGASHVVIVMKDITDIVVLEASLLRNERVAEMGHLVGAVAHEVRNPLFVISASFDALEARLDSSDLTISAHLKNLHEQIGRLSALMHDLLEYGKPPELNITVAPLESALDDAISRVAGDAACIVNEFPPALGGVLMDQARLARAFQNLLENAMHHSDGRGAVTVRGGRVEHSMRTWIWCSIDDAGPGFSGTDAARVFEPFFSKRPGGTGLGLSIVQRTVEIHGGRIFAENAEGGGARMTIELPRMED
jgi:PAS domain S-box-containing protein